MLRKLFRSLEAKLGAYGYGIHWRAPSLVAKPDAQLLVSLELVCAHLLLSNPSPVFLEIGANDGVSADPMWPFVRRFGWRGVMVEPLPNAFSKLEANYAAYPQVQLVNAAIGPQDGKKSIYTVKEFPGQYERASFFASFRKEILLQQTQWIPDVANQIEELVVPCYTLATLLEKTRIGNVDILQIDTEGFDAEILKMVDFRKLNPSIIQFEYINLSKTQIDDCARMLMSRGYKLAGDSLDVIAYRGPESLGWR